MSEAKIALDRTGPASTRDTDAVTRPITVWDAPTRIFHWLIVVLVTTAYVTWRLNWMDWHLWAGYAALTLVLFRLLWGVFGSATARFRHFLASPREALRHLGHLARREPDTQVGHNPAGGLMVLLLLGLLLGETLTGIYSNNDVANEGPFSEVLPSWLSNGINNLHGYLWDVLFAAVVLHLLAILAYALFKRQNLVAPMLTGRKALPPSVAAPAVATLWRAVLALAVSILVAALLINFL